MTSPPSGKGATPPSNVPSEFPDEARIVTRTPKNVEPSIGLEPMTPSLPWSGASPPIPDVAWPVAGPGLVGIVPVCGGPERGCSLRVPYGLSLLMLAPHADHAPVIKVCEVVADHVADVLVGVAVEGGELDAPCGSFGFGGHPGFHGRKSTPAFGLGGAT